MATIYNEITTQDLALKITTHEGLKEEVNIAQANEIANILPKIFLKEYTVSAILTWLMKGFCDDSAYEIKRI